MTAPEAARKLSELSCFEDINGQQYSVYRGGIKWHNDVAYPDEAGEPGIAYAPDGYGSEYGCWTFVSTDDDLRASIQRDTEEAAANAQ